MGTWNRGLARKLKWLEFANSLGYSSAFSTWNAVVVGARFLRGRAGGSEGRAARG